MSIDNLLQDHNIYIVVLDQIDSLLVPAQAKLDKLIAKAKKDSNYKNVKFTHAQWVGVYLHNLKVVDPVPLRFLRRWQYGSIPGCVGPRPQPTADRMGESLGIMSDIPRLIAKNPQLKYLNKAQETVVLSLDLVIASS